MTRDLAGCTAAPVCLTSVTFSSGGRQLLYHQQRRHGRIYDTSTGRSLRTLDPTR
jgi:hypothetical protein